MPRKKSKNKVEKIMEFADGKDHLQDEALAATSLEEALGMTKPSPFKEKDLSSFEDSLSSMNLSEMQELAVQAGVFPSGTKMTLKTKLIKCFRQYSSGMGKVVQVTSPIVDPDSKQGKALLDLIKDQ